MRSYVMVLCFFGLLSMKGKYTAEEQEFTRQVFIYLFIYFPGKTQARFEK